MTIGQKSSNSPRPLTFQFAKHEAINDIHWRRDANATSPVVTKKKSVLTNQHALRIFH
jgi:hypothetical protein